MWNFRTPITFLASVVWNISESCGLPLGRFAHVIFEMLTEFKGQRVLRVKFLIDSPYGDKGDVSFIAYKIAKKLIKNKEAEEVLNL